VVSSNSSTNKTDRHDIADILLKVTLSTISHANLPINCQEGFFVFVFVAANKILPEH
jgi:hypothetical protein